MSAFKHLKYFRRTTSIQLIATFCLILAGQTPAKANVVCSMYFKLYDGEISAHSVEENAVHLSKENVDVEFQNKIENSLATIQELEVPYQSITKIGQRLGDGAFASVVVSVHTNQGLKALKIYDSSRLSYLTSTFVIQNALAKINRAPAITGYLSKKQLSKLILQYPQIKNMLQGRGASFGILMDYIDIAKDHYSNDLASTPNRESQTVEIENEMMRLRIMPAGDLQFAVTPNGRLMLVDFDGYNHLNSNGSVYGLGLGKNSLAMHLFESEYEYKIGAELLKSNWFYITEGGDFIVRLSKMRSELHLNP